MDKTLYIYRDVNGKLHIVYYDMYNCRHHMSYIGYSKRYAVQKFRKQYGLQGKHLDIVDI